MKIPGLYKKYNFDKDYTSIGLFRTIKNKYEPLKVFYPGSYVHITPSLIFSDVTYADSYKNTYKFYENRDTIEYINSNKEYPEKTKLKFYQQDYNMPFEELTEEFDLLISQYAGFIGQATKGYLKKGGLLVCNNSHGDASMASFDPEYKLIAVYRRKTDDQFSISDKDLSSFLIPKNDKEPDLEKLKKTMKGIAYTKSPTGYIFEKK